MSEVTQQYLALMCGMVLVAFSWGQKIFSRSIKVFMLVVYLLVMAQVIAGENIPTMLHNLIFQ